VKSRSDSPRSEAYVQHTMHSRSTGTHGEWHRSGSRGSQVIVWYAREDSNLWPLAPEASALSAELRAHVSLRQLYSSSSVAMPTGQR
jgi:hypothetical protein